MFAVVQFIEHNKFQVLAVPVSWIKSGILLWPKLSNEKIEGLRVSGAEYHGASRRIPVIIWKKFRKFDAAEKAADDLAKRDVSDVEGKRKKLKPQKKPPLKKSKNYNAMFAALQDTANSPQKNAPPVSATGSMHSENSEVECQVNSAADAASSSQSTPKLPPTSFSQVQKTTVLTTPKANLTGSSLTMPPPPNPSSPCRFQTKQLASTFTRPVLGPQTQQQQSILRSIPNDSQEHNPVYTGRSNGFLMTHSQPQFSGTATNTVIIEAATTNEQNQSEPIFCTTEDLYFLPDTVTDHVDMERHLITDHNGSIRYEELKKDLKLFIQTTMEEVVEKCFQDHFSRLAALSQMNTKGSTQPVPNAEDDPVENHKRIDSEIQLHNWNVKLGNEDLCAKYLVYFTRIIPPNSYDKNGDNACYTIVDCLFTRDFWTRFTWTGISRGQKSKRGFREFGNVLQLLVKLVCIGDPSYTVQKLEEFCRARLFRYSKSRSTNRQLRKSACRPARKQKRNMIHDDQVDCNIKHEEPLELNDDVHIDSAEEIDQYEQDESMDVEANEADSEHDDEDENTAYDDLSD